MIRTKTTLPPLRAEFEPRPRVSELVEGMVDRYQVTLVTATAGSGKTSVVAEVAARSTRPVAWLTLDRLDVSAGRLLGYLEAALDAAGLGGGGTATGNMHRGVSQPESAAMLAEAVHDLDALIVLDELERVADSAVALESVTQFLRFLPPAVHVVVISRRVVDVDLGGQELAGHVGRIGEADLALTVEEARRVLALRDADAVDVEIAVESTRGWMTGVLFESWRSADHVHGSGGEADPLRSYLSTEMMAGLPAELAEFLERTSLIDEVTPARAEALGITRPAARMAALRRHRLPIDFVAPDVLRCHPGFREYLAGRLLDYEPARLRALHAACGGLLEQEGRSEEAVDEYLRAGDIARAEDVAATVMPSVARRLDFDLLAGWLGAFRRWRIDSSAPMTAVELLVASEREEYGRGAACADRLRAMAPSGALADAAGPNVVAAAAWCYFLIGRIDDALVVLHDAPVDPQITILRFAVGVELVDSPVHYRDRPAGSGGGADGWLARIDLAHGRFERLVESTGSRSEAARLSRFGALTGLGRLEEAQAMLAAPDVGAGWTRVRLAAELLAESGRPEDAWSVLIEGRTALASTESCVYRMFSLLTEAMLALRSGRNTAHAAAVLRAVEQEPTATRRVRVLEQLSLWHGLAALIDGDPSAAPHLRRAVALMTEWDRLLWLPVAATYLAEAEWRAGDEAAADAAVELARATSLRTGSRHALIRALQEFPAVLSRRLDVESDLDSPWHELGRAVIADTPRGDAGRGTPVRVSEFGDSGLTIGERHHGLKLGKSVELLSYLAWSGGSAPRQLLIRDLFDSKNDKAAAAYLRMAVNGVRSVVGTDRVVVDDENVIWTGGALHSDYSRLLTRLSRLRNVDGAQRLSLAMDALVDIPTGVFLPAGRSNWAAEHRRRWGDLVLDIRHAASEAAYDVGDYRLAQLLVAQVLTEDRFRERAWRLAMRIAAAVGDGDRVIDTYRRCSDALAEMGIEPADSTRKLLRRLHV